MAKTITKPKACTKKMLIYLDLLRESGVTNMYGARPYLMRDFGVLETEATEILSYWMKTFGGRGTA